MGALKVHTNTGWQPAAFQADAGAGGGGGAGGASPSAHPYVYNAAQTTGSPGAGKIIFNQAGVYNFTRINISLTDFDGLDTATLYLDMLQPHYFLRLSDVQGRWVIARVLKVVDQVDHYELFVDTISYNMTTFQTGSTLSVDVVSPAPAITNPMYKYAGTGGVPGDSEIRLSQANLDGVTSILVNLHGLYKTDWAYLFTELAAGSTGRSKYLVHLSNAFREWGVYNVLSVDNNGGWFTLHVETVEATSYQFQVGQQITLTFLGGFTEAAEPAPLVFRQPDQPAGDDIPVGSHWIDTDAPNPPPQVQAGVAAITMLYGTETLLAVSFPTPFETPPVVVVSANNTLPGTHPWSVGASNVSTSGFEIWAYSLYELDITVSWIATVGA